MNRCDCRLQQVRPNSPGGKGVIDQPPEKVWQIVSECASYKKRMPRIEAFLRQNPAEIAPFAESVQKMGAALK